MGAPKGNKNAEKWTAEVTLDACEKMLQGLSDGTCVFLGEALDLVDDLSEEQFCQLQKKFKKENDVVFKSLMRVRQKAKHTVIGGGLRNELNPQLVKFLCEASYGMSTKAEDMKIDAIKSVVSVEVVDSANMQERATKIRESLK